MNPKTVVAIVVATTGLVKAVSDFVKAGKTNRA